MWSHILLDYLMQVSKLSSYSSGPWLPLHFHLVFLSPQLCHLGSKILIRPNHPNIPFSKKQWAPLTSCLPGPAQPISPSALRGVLFVSLGRNTKKMLSPSSEWILKTETAHLDTELCSQNRKCLHEGFFFFPFSIESKFKSVSFSTASTLPESIACLSPTSWFYCWCKSPFISRSYFINGCWWNLGDPLVNNIPALCWQQMQGYFCCLATGSQSQYVWTQGSRLVLEP